MNNEPLTAIQVRLPKPVYKKLKEMAVKNVRSLNGEMLVAIQKHVNLSQATEPSETEASKAPRVAA